MNKDKSIPLNNKMIEIVGSVDFQACGESERDVEFEFMAPNENGRVK